MVISFAGEPVLAYLLASVRIVAWLAVVPPFSSKAVPNMVKVVLSLGLAFATAPGFDKADVPVDTGGFLFTVLVQVGVGLAMGFVTMMLFSSVAAAGSLVDVFGGFSLAQGFDPLGQNSSTIFGTFHSMLASTLLFVSGGYLMVIGGLIKTFTVLPVGALPDLEGGPDALIGGFNLFLITAIQIALPLVVVLFIADLGLALLTKVAPQLNALNVMFPAKIGLTLLVVGISFPLLPGVLDTIVKNGLDALSTIAGG